MPGGHPGSTPVARSRRRAVHPRAAVAVLAIEDDAGAVGRPSPAGDHACRSAVVIRFATPVRGHGVDRSILAIGAGARMNAMATFPGGVASACAAKIASHTMDGAAIRAAASTSPARNRSHVVRCFEGFLPGSVGHGARRTVAPPRIARIRVASDLKSRAMESHARPARGCARRTGSACLRPGCRLSSAETDVASAVSGEWPGPSEAVRALI